MWKSNKNADLQGSWSPNWNIRFQCVQSDLSAGAETSRFSCFVYTTQLKDIRNKRTVSCFDSSIIHSLHYGLPWWSITVKNKPASKTWNKPELNLKSTPVTYIPAAMCPNKCFLFVLSDRNILSFFMGSYLCYLERRSEEDGNWNGNEARKFKEMILCPKDLRRSGQVLFINLKDVVQWTRLILSFVA